MQKYCHECGLVWMDEVGLGDGRRRDWVGLEEEGEEEAFVWKCCAVGQVGFYGALK